MEKRHRLGILGVLLMLLVAAFATLAVVAAEIHVPADYSGLQAAVTAAASGDTIIVAAGNYGGVSIGGKTDLTIRGKPGAVINNGRVLINNCTNLTFEGFQITSPKEGILVIGENTGLNILENVITGCKTHGIVVKGMYCNLLIADNTINGNCFDGIQLLGKTSCEEEVQNPVVIRNNRILDNGACSSTGVGIRVGADNSGVLIEGNVIKGNSFAGIHPA